VNTYADHGCSRQWCVAVQYFVRSMFSFQENILQLSTPKWAYAVMTRNSDVHKPDNDGHKIHSEGHKIVMATAIPWDVNLSSGVEGIIYTVACLLA